MNRAETRSYMVSSSRRPGKKIIHYSMPRDIVASMILSKLLPPVKSEPIMSAKKAKEIVKKITGKKK